MGYVLRLMGICWRDFTLFLPWRSVRSRIDDALLAFFPNFNCNEGPRVISRSINTSKSSYKFHNTIVNVELCGPQLSYRLGASLCEYMT